MQQELTNVSCEIIAKVGTAKGLFVEAIETAAAGQLDQARALLSEGEQIFNQGHEGQGRPPSRSCGMSDDERRRL